VGPIIWLYQAKFRKLNTLTSELITQQLYDRLMNSNFHCSYSQSMMTIFWQKIDISRAPVI